MTPYDLDLIEHAAQAAGYETTRLGPLGLSAAPATGPIPRAIAANTRIEARREDAFHHAWNPLADDAQTLGLQQLLGIKVGVADGIARAQIETPDEDTPWALFEESVLCEVPAHLIGPEHASAQQRLLAEDQAATVRRVVVRAAAPLVSPDPHLIRSVTEH